MLDYIKLVIFQKRILSTDITRCREAKMSDAVMYLRAFVLHTLSSQGLGSHLRLSKISVLYTRLYKSYSQGVIHALVVLQKRNLHLTGILLVTTT